MTQTAFTQQQPYKIRRRSRDDRLVAGICVGFGRYLNLDPVAARVIFVALAVVTGGTAVIAYLLAWLIMPEEPIASSWSAPTPPATAQPPASYQSAESDAPAAA